MYIFSKDIHTHYRYGQNAGGRVVAVGRAKAEGAALPGTGAAPARSRLGDQSSFTKQKGAPPAHTRGIAGVMIPIWFPSKSPERLLQRPEITEGDSR